MVTLNYRDLAVCMVYAFWDNTMDGPNALCVILSTFLSFQWTLVETYLPGVFTADYIVLLCIYSSCLPHLSKGRNRLQTRRDLPPGILNPEGLHVPVQLCRDQMAPPDIVHPNQKGQQVAVENGRFRTIDEDPFTAAVGRMMILKDFLEIGE